MFAGSKAKVAIWLSSHVEAERIVEDVLITIGQGYYLIFVIDWPEAARVARAKALEVQAAAAKTKSTSGANALV